MTTSAADGAASVFLFRRQESKIALHSASGCDPCHSLHDVAAGRSRSEEVRGVIWYAVVGATAEYPVDDSIPDSAPIVTRRSFSAVVDDPLERLVGDGCDGRRLGRAGNAGSVSDGMLLRAGHSNHVWAISFEFTETTDYRTLKPLHIVDGHTREALAMDAVGSLGTNDMMAVIERLVQKKGYPGYR